MIVASQINNMLNMSKTSFSGPLPEQGQSSGGFTNVLAKMMNNGDNQGGDMMSMLKSEEMSIEDLLQSFMSDEAGNKGLDPLLLSFIQQLMTNPQQFQEFLQDILATGDRGIKQIAQMNYGQLKEFSEIIKEMLSNANSKQPLAAGLMKGEGKDNALYNKLIASEPIAVAAADNLEPPVMNSQSAYVKSALQGAMAKMTDAVIKGENVSMSINGNNESLSAKELSFLKGKDFGDGKFDALFSEQASLNKSFDFNSEIVMGEAIKDNGLIAPNHDDDFNSVIKDAMKMAVVQDSNKHEGASVVGGTNQTPQTTSIRNDQAAKETLHVSRIQEIDTRIVKAVESGQNSLTLRLEPPELGSVKIKLVLADGMVRADIRVENAAVKDMMNLAMPQIKNSLENAGIKVSEFFVDIREEYYSDGRRHNQDNDAHKQQKQEKDKEEDFKPFDFFI